MICLVYGFIFLCLIVVLHGFASAAIRNNEKRKLRMDDAKKLADERTRGMFDEQ